MRLKAVEAGCSVEETVRVILRQATAANAPGIAPTGADAQGPITWTRDELYD